MSNQLISEKCILIKSEGNLSEINVTYHISFHRKVKMFRKILASDRKCHAIILFISLVLKPYSRRDNYFNATGTVLYRKGTPAL